MWFWFALGSAVFAALTSILAKIGIEGVNSNLATAIRTVVVVVMAWGHSGRGGHGLGHGVPDERTGRHQIHQPEKLDLPDPVRPCHGRFLAVLLQSFADRGGVQSRTHRQTECGHYPGTGFYHTARRIHHEIPDRLHPDRRGDAGHGAVNQSDMENGRK